MSANGRRDGAESSTKLTREAARAWRSIEAVRHMGTRDLADGRLRRHGVLFSRASAMASTSLRSVSSQKRFEFSSASLGVVTTYGLGL